jgi:RimJ/RimL family protein N-acetyltransferase
MIAGFTRLADMELAAYEDADFALTETLETDPVVMRELGGPTDPSRLPEVHLRRLGDPWWFKIVPEPSGPPAGTIGIWEKELDGETIHETGWMVLPAFQGRGVATAALALLIARLRAEPRFESMHAFPPVTNVECSVPEVRLLAARRARLRVRRPDAALQPLDAADAT